jgi:hypothetical protein
MTLAADELALEECDAQRACGKRTYAVLPRRAAAARRSALATSVTETKYVVD